MSSKFLHGFGEESSELRKQIGCMTGIFRMFDRHNLLGGRSFNGSQNQKLPSGNSLINISSNAGAHNVSCSQLVLEKNLNKSLNENQRMSMESSRTSFSSSSCSSFSSVDCNKSTPQEPISFNQTMKNLPNLKCSEIDAKNAHRSVDFQNVAKESTNKEPYCLSVQASCKDEFKQPILSYMDSPRPMQLSKSMDGSFVIGIDEKSRSPLDLNESFRVLMKLKDAPWSFSENTEPSFGAKEAPFSRTSRDGHRFSYDGRDISSNFVDSRENFRPSSKLKDLPRLSLDSRESSMRSCNSVVKDLYRSSSNKERCFPPSSTQKEFESQKSAPSVVAKLMGLDSMPTSCFIVAESVDAVKNYAVEKPVPSGLQRGNKILNNSLHPSKEGRLSKSSRTPMESAPWKKESHVPQNTLAREDTQLNQKPETVYSEIEKRLKEIEFRHANKDLRALKQILDSMQVKGLLESKKNEEQRSPKSVYHNSNHVVTTRSAVSRRPPLPASTKGRNMNKTYESPIVIMKPAKSFNIFDVTETSVISLHGLTRLPMVRTSKAVDKKKLSGSSKLSRDSSPRTSPRINGKIEENVQRSRVRTELGASKHQQSLRDINGGVEKSSNSVSPRLQQRKLEVERRISSSVSSSDSCKPQMLFTNKDPTESISPRNKLRRRPTRLQGNDEQLAECIETRNLNPQGDEISQRSDGIMSSESKLIKDYSSTKISLTSSEQGVQSLSTSLVLKQMYSPVAPEQPSPVSVLDATFYQDDLPISEVKRSPDQFKGINSPSSDILCEPHHISSEVDQKKLESFGNLFWKLKELNQTSEGASTTDHIASLCRTSSRDHRYISEILLASSLLMKELGPAPVGLMPIQVHPSGHPINPDLFFVLEQTKSSQISNFDTEKLHRKLLFDAVNEILIQILEGRRSISHKLRGSVPSGQQLLKELCSEVDRIHADPLKADVFDDDSNIIDESVLRKSAEWNDFRRGVPGIVLDIERLIFKDLIAEIVDGEAAGLKHKCGRRRRQLFVK